MNNPACCGQTANVIEDEVNNIKGFGVFCDICGTAIFHEKRDEAIREFNKKANHVEVKPLQQNNKIVPVNRNNLSQIFQSKRNELSSEVMPILSNSGSAFERLMKNNTVKYLDKILLDDSFVKVSPESIIHEIEEATIMGAELGKMGDIIPFDKTCLFIPSIEACDFALTNGVNAPFLDFNIKCEYEGDDFESGMKDSNYFVNILHEGNKEVVKNVYVWGTLAKTGLVVGEKYASKRLLEKALESSKPYQKYMKYKKAYDYQKSEGKTIIDQNGRESFKYYESAKSDDKYFDKSVAYFKQAEDNNQLKSDAKGDYAVQTLPKKSGGTWDNKIYRFQVEGGTVATTIYVDELKNPYAGANQPEMLKKTAGKSFSRPFLKVRNSEAAMHEVRGSSDAVKETLDLASGQFEEL